MDFLRISGWRVDMVGAMIRAITLCAALIAAPAHALDVRRDMGGSVDDRAAHIQQLRATGTPVRITGTCVSACTMFLLIACVSPRAKLGFHGPATAIGLPMTRAEFDRVSAQMAAHYPPQIAAWFMRTGRLMTGDYYTITGSEAVRMGARECQ